MLYSASTIESFNSKGNYRAKQTPIETKHKLNCFHGFHNVCSLRFISLYFSCGGFVKVSHFHMRHSSVRVSSNKCFHTEKEMNERNVRQLDQSSRSTHWIIQFRGDKMDKTKNTRQPLFESYIFALPRGIIYALHIALRPPPLTHKWDMLKDTLSFTRIAICSAHIYFSFFFALFRNVARNHIAKVHNLCSCVLCKIRGTHTILVYIYYILCPTTLSHSTISFFFFLLP